MVPPLPRRSGQDAVHDACFSRPPSGPSGEDKSLPGVGGRSPKAERDQADLPQPHPTYKVRKSGKNLEVVDVVLALNRRHDREDAVQEEREDEVHETADDLELPAKGPVPCGGHRRTYLGLGGG